MRKTDREVKEIEKISEILDNCDTVRIGFFDTEYPYIVPLSFGYEIDGAKIIIYTHGAKEGKKHDLAINSPKVCVEADLCKGFVYKGEENRIPYALNQ